MEYESLVDSYAAQFRQRLSEAASEASAMYDRPVEVAPKKATWNSLASRRPTATSLGSTSAKSFSVAEFMSSPNYPDINQVLESGASLSSGAGVVAEVPVGRSSGGGASAASLADGFLAEYRAALDRAAVSAEQSPLRMGPSLAVAGGPLSHTRSGVDGSLQAHAPPATLHLASGDARAGAAAPEEQRVEDGALSVAAYSRAMHEREPAAHTRPNDMDRVGREGRRCSASLSDDDDYDRSDEDDEDDEDENYEDQGRRRRRRRETGRERDKQRRRRAGSSRRRRRSDDSRDSKGSSDYSEFSSVDDRVHGKQHAYPMPIPLPGPMGQYEGVVAGDGDGLVLVPIASLRENSAALIDTERAMRALQDERDNLSMRLEATAARLSAVEMDRDGAVSEVVRLRSALGMKDDMIGMLHAQLAGAQGNIAQVAANAAVAAAQGMGGANGNGAPQVNVGLPSPSGTGATDEEFMLLSDEVATLQAQLGEAQRDLAIARAQAPQAHAGSASEESGPYGPGYGSVVVPIAGPGSPVKPSMGEGAIAARARSHASYDDIANENLRLRQQLGASKEESDMLRAAADAAASFKAELMGRVESSREEAEKARAGLDTARTAAAIAEKEAKRTAANLSTSEAEADRMKRRLNEAESRSDVLSRTLEGAQADARAASSALDDVRRQLAARVHEVEEARETMHMRAQELAHEHAEAEGLRDSLRRAQADLSRLSAQYGQAQAQIASLSHQVAMGSSSVPTQGMLMPSAPPVSSRRGTVAAPPSVPAYEETGHYGHGQQGGPPAPRRQAMPSQDHDNSQPSSSLASPGRHSAAHAQGAREGDSRSRLFGGMAPDAELGPHDSRRQQMQPVFPPYVPPGQPSHRSPHRNGSSGAGGSVFPPFAHEPAALPAPLYSRPVAVPAPAPAAVPVPEPAPRPSPPAVPQPVYSAPAPPAPERAYGQHGAAGDPYGRAASQPAPAVYPSAAGPLVATAPAPATERARRLAILSDIAASNSRGGAPSMAPPPPPATGLPGFNGFSGPAPTLPASANSYDAYAMASVGGQGTQGGTGEAYKRIRAQAVSEDGHVLNANASSTDTAKVLPFSSMAARAVEEEDRARAIARPSKEESDTHSWQREAQAPFATEASVATLEAIVASKEAALLSANVAKTDVEGELKRLSSSAGSRTVRDRARKAELEGQMVVLDKQLAELRRWLKTNAP